MRICIFGAGAIGGYLGALLHQAGAEVGLVARGDHLAAMRRSGLTLRTEDKEITVHPPCTDDPAEFGPQEYVFVCLKAHSVPGVVDAMRPLLGPATAVVTAVNGIPYWYFHRHGGPFEGSIVESVDPGGRQWKVLGPERAIGCVVYPATEVVSPGVVRHVYGDRFPVGEPDGSLSDRVRRLSELLEAAGLKAPVRDRIRDEIWLKLWGNLCFNPISALTHATLDVICADPGTRAVARAMMLEAKAIGDRLAVHFRVDVERRIDGAGAVGAHKTSMLQDLERGRPMEIDALLTVVQELGRRVEVPTPTIDVVLALVRQRAETAGLYARPEVAAAALKEAAVGRVPGQ
jgi:2-dehydropantoate 2-reductase